MEEIIIAGGVAVLRNVQEVKRVKTEDLLNAVSATSGLQTPIMPEGALLYSCKGKHKTIVTCRPPGLSKFKVKVGDEVDQLEIRHPWLVFFHSFEGAAYDTLWALGASMRPVADECQLVKLPFRNLYGDAHVCMGRDLKFSLKGQLQEKTKAAEAHFFESVFNGDLDVHALNALPRNWSLSEESSTMHLWAKKSALADFEPEWVEWKPAAKLGEKLTQIMEGV